MYRHGNNNSNNDNNFNDNNFNSSENSLNVNDYPQALSNNPDFCKGEKHHPPRNRGTGYFTKLHFAVISSSGALWSIKYSFIVITP